MWCASRLVPWSILLIDINQRSLFLSEDDSNIKHTRGGKWEAREFHHVLQTMIAGDESCDVSSIECDAPQGSCLGPFSLSISIIVLPFSLRTYPHKSLPGEGNEFHQLLQTVTVNGATCDVK